MLKRFFLLLLTVMGWGGSFAAQASPWPYFSMRITECEDLFYHDCHHVFYGDATTKWREIPDNVKATIKTTRLEIWGLHCEFGDRIKGFTGCYWQLNHGDKHNPQATGLCKSTAPDNFILADPRFCELPSNFVGGHVGAFPGFECAALGKYYLIGGTYGALDTPFGPLDPLVVANSGNTYCGKSPEPWVNCDINIANGGILDHGIQAPTSSSERTLDVTVNCGASPVFSIVDNTLKLDNDRIQSDLSITPNGGAYLLKSVLTSTNASAGNYSGSTVVVVTPN